MESRWAIRNYPGNVEKQEDGGKVEGRAWAKYVKKTFSLKINLKYVKAEKWSTCSVNNLLFQYPEVWYSLRFQPRPFSQSPVEHFAQGDPKDFACPKT